MPRIVTIEQNRISSRGTARAATQPASRIDKRVQSTPDQWANGNRWARVISSNVAAIRYERPAMKLHVRFKNGSEYYYPSVNITQAKQMFNCSSMGKYVWKLRRAGYVGIKTK